MITRATAEGNPKARRSLGPEVAPARSARAIFFADDALPMSQYGSGPKGEYGTPMEGSLKKNIKEQNFSSFLSNSS